MATDREQLRMAVVENLELKQRLLGQATYGVRVAVTAAEVEEAQRHPGLFDLAVSEVLPRDRLIRRELGQPSAVASAAGIAPKRRARPYHTAVLFCQNEED